MSALQLEAVKALKCRYECDDPPIGIYHTPEGCVCWPDPVQALCIHHAVRVQSEGSIDLLVDLTVDGAWARHLRGER